MNNNQFTDDELYMLSDGILSLIRNTNEALRLVYDSKSIKVLQETQSKYKDLNRKICDWTMRRRERVGFRISTSLEYRI